MAPGRDLLNALGLLTLGSCSPLLAILTDCNLRTRCARTARTRLNFWFTNVGLGSYPTSDTMFRSCLSGIEASHLPAKSDHRFIVRSFFIQ